MQPCPPNRSGIPATGWKPYFGMNWAFHCNFYGVLEDKIPTPDSRQNECIYDDQGQLVDENHLYADCRGTPNSYDSKTDAYNHLFNDPGGPYYAGRPAALESGRKVRDDVQESVEKKVEALKDRVGELLNQANQLAP
jgi:hypothetical protein